MKHRCIAVLLGATLSLSAITGCGASGSDSSSSASEDERIFGTEDHCGERVACKDPCDNKEKNRGCKLGSGI